MDAGENGFNPILDAGFKMEENKPYRALEKLRGGSAGAEGSSGLLAILSEFWNSTFRRASSSIKKSFSRSGDIESKLLEQLKTTPVQAVSVPNSTVLPPEVVRVAVKRSGMLGSPLRADRVQEIAKSIKRWYVRNGYVLHSVTGATLKTDSATAEIEVDEPVVSSHPVDITIFKEMVVDEEGKLLTFRQYLEGQAARNSFRHDRIEKKDLNTTFVQTAGRTKSSKVARALKLQPGSPFQWNNARWEKIAASGIFSKVLRISPHRMNDGTVQLQVYATEPPPRHLEYGLGKSLYTGSWEGEVDFEHQNLFGGGEMIGLMVRRGTKDVEPSVRVRFSDDRFGLEGGFDFELFSDFLGDSSSPSVESGGDSPNGDLCFRKGTTLRVRNPISTKVIRHSVASTSLERTSSRSGKHEKIGSSTLTLGPVRMSLPFDARSSFVTTMTGGARLGEEGSLLESIMPYASASATARQVLPLSDPNKSRESVPVLALQHTIATSSKHLPRHEAKAMGVSAQIRGCGPDGGAMSSVKGTAELRVPILSRWLKSSHVVVFGDWYCIQQNLSDSFNGKSSIGVGLRKVVQGLPLKYDVCYTSDGKIKTIFGLGPDFDA